MKLRISTSSIHESLKRAAAFIVAVRFQFLKYAITGSLTFVIDYGIFIILNSVFGIFYIGASAISQACAVIFNFITQKNWTFASTGNTKQQLVRYILLLIWNYCFSLLALFILVDIFEIHVFLGKIIAVGIIVSWNFLAYKFIVYRH